MNASGLAPLRLIQTTLEREDDAHRIAEGLVSAHLAACVQAERIRSTYRWQGALERAEEIRLTIKTTDARLADCLEWLRAHHPYELPEIVVLEARAEPSYARWADEATRKT